MGQHKQGVAAVPGVLNAQHTQCTAMLCIIKACLQLIN